MRARGGPARQRIESQPPQRTAIAEYSRVLSHSSIVAREYGIPAVVSVDGATQLPEGTMVTVDGCNGVVHLSMERRE